ncbi:hypothetical protein KO516_21480 [Citreicella sp. C3M06]|uniref:hypothetical protein n=1 Tax=Citreicella sp. C3M06 TaxID=2841564 RepID=UPI001C0A50F0|nr:hypothetical protein [Citreicella sp. C3M06]MBU2963348.1 hypothetical protein [Citreicella sp. C3M06]
MTAQEFTPEDRIFAHLRLAIAEAQKVPNGQSLLGAALCVALDTVAGGAPRYEIFGDMRADAALWVECATPVEVELYGGAALAAIERRPFAPKAKRRIFAMLWQSMTVEEREAFLSRVMKRAA